MLSAEVCRRKLRCLCAYQEKKVEILGSCIRTMEWSVYRFAYFISRPRSRQERCCSSALLLLATLLARTESRLTLLCLLGLNFLALLSLTLLALLFLSLHSGQLAMLVILQIGD